MVVRLGNLVLDSLSNCNPVPHKKGEPDERSFSAMLHGDVTRGNSQAVHFDAQASVGFRVVLMDRQGRERTFGTEILQMDIAASIPPLQLALRIRESPSLPSRGMAMISRMPRGNFFVGSFFDIFPEFYDGSGQMWIPSTDGNGQRTRLPLRLASCDSQ